MNSSYIDVHSTVHVLRKIFKKKLIIYTKFQPLVVRVITRNTQSYLTQTTPPISGLPTYPYVPTIPTVFTLKGPELSPFIFLRSLL